MDHAGELGCRWREGVQAEEPEKLVVVPPQDVLGVSTRASIEHAPLELESPTVDLDGARLQLGYRSQVNRGQSASEGQHRAIPSRPSTSFEETSASPHQDSDVVNSVEPQRAVGTPERKLRARRLQLLHERRTFVAIS